jgi:RHS repeat-associated protein
MLTFNSGNVLNDNSHTYSWDSEGRPATIDSVNLTYDALGRMVEQNRSGVYTQFVYAPTGQKIQIMNGQATTKSLVALPGGGQAVYTATGQYYYHSDHLGSFRFASTSNRTMYFDLAHAPFGEVYANSGSTDPAFTSQRQDTVAGLYDFPAREYSTQGRWVSPDPAGLASVDPTNPQSWNRYAYVVNNPLSLVDPLGLSDCPDLKSTCGDDPGTDTGAPGVGLWGNFGVGGGCAWSDFWGGDCAATQRLLDPSGRGQSEPLVAEARYDSIISTGWDPELRIQYYTYSFAGGCKGALQCQIQLAAIQYGQQACAGQAPSAVANCILQVYNQLAQQGPAGIQGGNYYFSSGGLQINGQPINSNEFGCFMSRCGILDSLDYSHGNGTFHVDTANAWFFPIGTVLHTVVDVLGGSTWWSGGIPRFP